jgi:two-component system LytT family response regulator
MISTEPLRSRAALEQLRAAFVGSADTLEPQRAVLSLACRTSAVFATLTAGSLEALRGLTPDIVFLRPIAADGTELWEELADAVPALVLVADGPEHAVRAFEIGAVDYLVQPVGGLRLYEALGRAAQRLRLGRQPAGRGYLQRFTIRLGRRLRLVDAKEVQWISSAGNYVELYTRERRHRLRASLTELERRLDPRRFQRIHRRHIVCIDSVRQLRHIGRGEYELTLRSGTRLKLTRKYRDSLEALRPRSTRDLPLALGGS